MNNYTKEVNRVAWELIRQLIGMNPIAPIQMLVPKERPEEHTNIIYATTQRGRLEVYATDMHMSRKNLDTILASGGRR